LPVGIDSYQNQQAIQNHLKQTTDHRHHNKPNKKKARVCSIYNSRSFINRIRKSVKIINSSNKSLNITNRTMTRSISKQKARLVFLNKAKT